MNTSYITTSAMDIIPIYSKHVRCYVCGWIDDDYQNSNPNSLNGLNPMSLLQAREAYKTKNP